MRVAALGDRGPLQGELRIGAIPAVLAEIGTFVHAIRLRHPELRVSVSSLTSRQIDRGLDDYELDVGVTYLDSEPLAHVLQVELYRERYILVAHRDMGVADGPVTWAEAAALPLCLLPLSMQNRRILDAKLTAAGTAVAPKATANSYVALISMLRMGQLASIMPHSYAPYVAGDPLLNAHEISGQPTGTSVGVVVRDRQPLAPLANAAFLVAQSELLRRALQPLRDAGPA
jgi:DNA-binding transcriptional LysR family regulator